MKEHEQENPKLKKPEGSEEQDEGRQLGSVPAKRMRQLGQSVSRERPPTEYAPQPLDAQPFPRREAPSPLVFVDVVPSTEPSEGDTGPSEADDEAEATAPAAQVPRRQRVAVDVPADLRPFLEAKAGEEAGGALPVLLARLLDGQVETGQPVVDRDTLRTVLGVGTIDLFGGGMKFTRTEAMYVLLALAAFVFLLLMYGVFFS